jgi:hypothetical protein
MLETAAAPADVAELREEGGWFVVTLRRAAGDALGEKRLPAALDCAVRAQAAAVAIAAMEAQLGGGVSQPLPVAPPPTAPAPPATAMRPAVAVAAPAAPPPAAAPPFATEVSGAVLGSWNGTDLAPAGRLEVALRGAGSSWEPLLAGLAVGTHGIAVAPGAGKWWRLGGELALRKEGPVGVGAARMQVVLGAAITALFIQGHGFSRNGSDTLLDPGLTGHLRFVPLQAAFRPWIEVSGVYWPRSHELTVSEGVASRRVEVPTGELLIGVGASWGRPR